MVARAGLTGFRSPDDVTRRGGWPRGRVVQHRRCTGGFCDNALRHVHQWWSRCSGLAIPYQGPHCLRHSVAVHLLRQGTSLKAIGDLLGHRSAESTCVYLRLYVEDLRRRRSMKLTTLAITRCPARSLRTYTLQSSA
jgi:integrase